MTQRLSLAVGASLTILAATGCSRGLADLHDQIGHSRAELKLAVCGDKFNGETTEAANHSVYACDSSQAFDGTEKVFVNDRSVRWPS